MLPPSPAVPHPVSVHRAPPWMADYPDNDHLSPHPNRRPHIQPQVHPPSYYDFASYTHIPTSASEFPCSNPLPTYSTPPASDRDIWRYESSTFPEYFNAPSFHYQQDSSVLQNALHFPPGTHYLSDHLQPQYESPYATTSDTSVHPATPIYYNRDSGPHFVHSASASLPSFALPVSEATLQYQWAKQTGSEHGLAALTGDSHASYIEVIAHCSSASRKSLTVHPQSQEHVQPLSPPTPVLEYPPLKSHPAEAANSLYQSGEKYTAIAPSHPAQPSTDAPAYQMYRYPEVHFHQQHVYHQHTAYTQHEYRQSQGQEPDGPLMDHLPYEQVDDNLHISDGQPEAPTRSSSCQHVSDTAEPLTQNAQEPSDNSPLASRSVAPLPSLTVAIPPAARTTEQAEQPSPHTPSTSRSQPHSPCSPRPSKNHAQRVLARQHRSPSPRMTLRPPSRTSMRITPLPGTKRQLERKPPLACLFCRARKIACGAPAPGSTDRTCK